MKPKPLSHLNTYQATINEILIGYYLCSGSYEKFIDNQKVQDRLKSCKDIFPEDKYDFIDNLSMSMAKECFIWLVKNRFLQEIISVEWIAQGNHENPSDLNILYIDLDNNVCAYGISIKCSFHNNYQLGFKNYSYKTVFEKHFPNYETIPAFKQNEKEILQHYSIFDMKQKHRKEKIRSDDFLFHELYPHSVQRLSEARNIFYDILKELDEQSLKDYIFTKWFDKNYSRPYLKLTGTEKKIFIEDFSTCSDNHGEISIEKYKHNSILFYLDDIPLCSIHTKNNSEMFCSPIQFRAVSA